MAKQECKPGEYHSKVDRCCAHCPAGTYIGKDCDSDKPTECVMCERGLYTATENSMYRCRTCRDCNSSNKKRTVKECMADENTVCECMTGFYCNDADCDHCQPVKRCPVGEGVKVYATRTNNTICMPCEMGAYSNVSNFQSTCQTHTRCEDLGRVLKIPGTPTSDDVCGDFKSHCLWMLPAGLLSGLVLTSLILLVILCWRAKRKSRRADGCILLSGLTASFSVPVPPACVYKLELPLPATELNGHCQESCRVEECEMALFYPVDNVVSCSTPDSVESINPRTPLMASVSFSESNHIIGKAGNRTSNSLTTHSEPQEDEWCGT